MEITTFTLALPFGLGSVNCYLLKTPTGCFLIDTGPRNRRAQLLAGLQTAGCRPGLLRLILLTHGDFDHTGNVTAIRAAFGCPAAMHPADRAMAEHGEMFANRKQPSILLRKLAPLLFGFGRAERFTPDLLVDEGFDLSAFGLEARVIAIPGHSAGSIAVLTAGGELFSGDLLDSTPQGATLGSLTDDLAAAQNSIDRLKSLPVRVVYPGHGPVFSMSQVKG